jgi:pimeloyl-ACP methyl ester carboxylesterase
MRPTIILVHGAFAESSSWDGVIDQLLGCGLSGAAFRSARLRLATRKTAACPDTLWPSFRPEEMTVVFNWP